MMKEERQQAILNILNSSGFVEVSQLCRVFDVTEMTIRRDLNELAAKKRVIRSHGGAILPAGSSTGEDPYAVRIMDNLDRKEAIARAALRFVQNGEKVFFDSSTSAYCLARKLTNEHSFVAVTDTIYTAMELMTRTGIKVICIGGELNKSTGACTGVFAEDMYERMVFDTAFIGVSQITVDGQITTKSVDEYKSKRQIMHRSKRTILLADSSKIGDSGFLQTASLRDLYAMVTDDGVSPEFVSNCRKHGHRLIIAPTA
ncbi:MAG: DeoR/GlpR transcriptional regulator [Oscillospiraceae bacterium]|nr:DeoR/GlpR transcriptional regulator [Oscillospiraceae bacterium]